MDDKKLDARKVVLGVKSKCAHDVKVVENGESLEDVPEDASKASSLKQLKVSDENETKELSQTPAQCKSGKPRSKESMITSTPRVLRSRSQEKPKVQESVDVPLQDSENKEKKRKRRKKKKTKEDHNNEFSKIIKHLRYIVQKIEYKQSFLNAYVGEGWKGQSLEKLRPEKEIERAKSDIHRFKSKIRDLFKRIDTSCEEGRIPESLYDSEGEIDSEDIFCAKCATTEVRLDNDIILCDGACERGFHQFCLDPPLLKEQVPPGDEGWLCPACDCKADCVDLLNDYMATDLSIEDSWEKVFPETAGSGNILDDTLGLPSDDSEDDDFNPDAPHVEEDVVDTEDSNSSSDESDFSSASEDLGVFVNNEVNEELAGLPSDDSEDDDFNPDKVDSDEEVKKASSSSDFTSDSDDLGDIKNEVTSAEVQEPEMSQDKESLTEADMENDDCGLITARRNVERLDYKKLHDEAYGNMSSDSSDEDFVDSEAPSKQKSTDGTKDIKLKKKQKQSESTTPVRKTRKKVDAEDTSSSSANKVSSEKLKKKQKQSESTTPVRKTRKKVDAEDTSRSPANKGSSEKLKKKQKQSESTTPVRRTRKKVDVEDTGSYPANKGSSEKNGNRSSNKRLGEAATQRMLEAFKENHYPDRGVRENLVKELNLTHAQVSKWFENARWKFNHPEGHSKIVKSPTKPAEKIVTDEANNAISTAPKSRKRKTNADHQSSQTDSSGPTTRRNGRVQAKRL